MPPSWNQLPEPNPPSDLSPPSFPGRPAPPAQPLLPRRRRLHALLLAGEARLLRLRVHPLGRGAEQGRRGRRPRRHPGRPAVAPRRPAGAEEVRPGARRRRRGARAGDAAGRALRGDQRQDLQPAEGGVRPGHHGRAQAAEEEAEALEEAVLRLGGGVVEQAFVRLWLLLLLRLMMMLGVRGESEVRGSWC